MTSLEQRLRERYAEMVEGLSHDERGNLEGSREPLSTHDADDLARKLNGALWAALFDVAREIDQLKG